MSTDPPDTVQPQAEPVRFRFRIVHLLYATALIASSLATFGFAGMYLAGVLLAGWSFVFLSKSRSNALAVCVAVAVCGCCLLPSTYPYHTARRMQCSNNLKQIALALHNYYDIYKSFPPAVIHGADGQPMHSWRVLILPFMEGQLLYNQYDFNEPWNGPNNSRLATQMPAVYGCVSHLRGNCTSFAAVIGEHTMWTGDERGVQFADVSDGLSNTILVLEAEPQQLNWMEPCDVTYKEALKLLTSRDPKDLASGHKHQDFFTERWTGRNCVLADASTRFLPFGLRQDFASAMLLLDDGAAVDLDDPKIESRPVARLRLDNCFRLALFVIIALFPLPWVWRKPEISAAVA